jgi:hypothetical protein
MSVLRSITLAISLALPAAAALAQQSPASAASGNAAAATKADECQKAMPKHSHPVEKGAVPPAKAAPCAPAPASAAKAKPAHDHAKFHKNE